MSVLRALPDHDVKVGHGLFVLVNHLVGLGALMHVSNVVRVALDTPAVGPNRLLELLNSAVGQSNVVVDIGLNRH